MFDFWREATAASVPGFLCQSGRRRPENVSILSSPVSPLRRDAEKKNKINQKSLLLLVLKFGK